MVAYIANWQLHFTFINLSRNTILTCLCPSCKLIKLVGSVAKRMSLRFHFPLHFRFVS